MIRLKESMQTVVTAMKNPKMHVLLLKILLVLLAINYQVVTVICKDFVLFKFLRDIVLMCLAACVFYSNWHTISLKSRFHTVWVSVIAVFAFLVLAAIRTESFGVAFTFVRRYAYPMILLLCSYYTGKANR